MNKLLDQYQYEEPDNRFKSLWTTWLVAHHYKRFAVELLGQQGLWISVWGKTAEDVSGILRAENLVALKPIMFQATHTFVRESVDIA